MASSLSLCKRLHFCRTSDSCQFIVVPIIDHLPRLSALNRVCAFTTTSANTDRTNPTLDVVAVDQFQNSANVAPHAAALLIFENRYGEQAHFVYAFAGIATFLNKLLHQPRSIISLASRNM